MRTNVYVDGFNLYYGLLKDKPSRKWLDLARLARLVQPKATINRIRYFTALVSARPQDPQEPQRQQIYLRALRTIASLTIHLGQYRSHPVRMYLANPPSSGAKTVEVIKFEEKGSDVNLATLLLCDAADRDFEQAIVITNDSDLALPIERVRNRFKLRIGVYSPRPSVTSMLRLAATFCRPLRAGAVEASQFSHTMTDAKGSFSKPPHW